MVPDDELTQDPPVTTSVNVAEAPGQIEFGPEIADGNALIVIE